MVHDVWHSSLCVDGHERGRFRLSSPALRKGNVQYSPCLVEVAHPERKIAVRDVVAVWTPKALLRRLHDCPDLAEYVLCVASITSLYAGREQGRVQLQYVECGDDVPGGRPGIFYLSDNSIDVSVDDIVGRVGVNWPRGRALSPKGSGESSCPLEISHTTVLLFSGCPALFTIDVKNSFVHERCEPLHALTELRVEDLSNADIIEFDGTIDEDVAPIQVNVLGSTAPHCVGPIQ